MKLLLCLQLLAVTASAGWIENSVATVLLAEAGVDGREGMECVAEVLLNRKATTGKPIISHVNSKVFSSLKGTTVDARFNEFSKNDRRRLGVALEVASCLLNRPSELPRRVGGATHFCTLESQPYWASSMERVATVKHHKFYRARSGLK